MRAEPASAAEPPDRHHTVDSCRPCVIAGPDVWMEGDALAQLAAVARLEGCVRAVGMPDLHPGGGYPIGAVVATRGVVHPQLVGGDAGCGARVIATSVDRIDADRLERRLRAAFDDDVLASADPEVLFDAVWFHGAIGLAAVDGVPEGLRWLAGRVGDGDDLPVSGDPASYRGFATALGTIGAGNHFAEVTRVAEIRDRAAAATLGLDRGALIVLAHSGSRGLGTQLGVTWGTRPLRGDDLGRYRGELAGACRFARANRLVLTYRLLSALGAVREHTLRGAFDVTHNDVRPELVGGELAWVSRKGAAPAYADAMTVVLGSRGAPSWLMRGTGAEAGLSSVAHGAGRRMTRSEAVAKIKAKYRRTEVGRVAGGRVLCDDKALLYEEHPDAYKAIEPVVAAVEGAGLATRVAALAPVMTVKL